MSVKYLAWDKAEPPDAPYVSQELRKEGYGPFAYPWPPRHIYGPIIATHEQCHWLVKGTVTFITDSQKISMKEGDRVICSKGMSYTFEVTSPTGSYLLTGMK